ncbi:MAG: hypothetical protein U9Q07_02835, partial [Planctomycetota bacterium]|nr:hypothetical protein [Planctomycetota bacterium]
AEVELTPAREGTDGSIRKAHELRDVEPDKYYMPNQFVNENNVLAHYETSGAAVAGALRIAEKMDSGTIVVILPDRGDRYLSTMLFRSICAKCPP